LLAGFRGAIGDPSSVGGEFGRNLVESGVKKRRDPPVMNMKELDVTFGSRVWVYFHKASVSPSGVHDPGH
jgi:predicted alternative tryptophan synthase beta-subunit